MDEPVNAADHEAHPFDFDVPLDMPPIDADAQVPSLCRRKGSPAIIKAGLVVLSLAGVGKQGCELLVF